MQRDLRESELYREIESRAIAWFRPGQRCITGAEDLAVSPEGKRVAFTAVCMEKLEGQPAGRLALLDLASGSVRIATTGPGNERAPQWSPDGRTIAFISDRTGKGEDRLFLLDLESGSVRLAPQVEGWVEYLKWSLDGTRILLGVVGAGGDMCGASGATTTARPADSLPEWMPQVATGDEAFRWRSLWILQVVVGRVTKVTPTGVNPWDADWCGSDRIVLVASPSPHEGAWYSAKLQVLELCSNAVTDLYAPRYQLGCPVACTTGRQVLIVEGICSDRRVVAGDLLHIDVETSTVRRLATCGCDVTDVQWASDHHASFAGHRSLETVIGMTDLRAGASRLTWASDELTCGDLTYPRIAAIPGRLGWTLATIEGLLTAPSIMLVGEGAAKPLCTFGSPQLDGAFRDLQVNPMSWQAPDGMEIFGWWVHRSESQAGSVVMEIHGGPVWLHRSRYIGRSALRSTLLTHGHGLFLPNPRGSSGRGADFASPVLGDMGGAEARDLLAGLDHLVESGMADANRLVLWGGSHGGFMAAWLVTQDRRFAAAAAVAPTTDWISQYLTCHIPNFCEMFLSGKIVDPASQYHSRSPALHAGAVTTPTLSICGALDQVTPPGQALEFHNALHLQGVPSLLVTYPREGHGVRHYPAVIDFSTRLVDWFEHYLPPPQA